MLRYRRNEHVSPAPRRACSSSSLPYLSVNVNGGPMRPVIFVVDDDAGIVRLLRYALETEGFLVRAFAAAADVLRESSRPHLFLLDRGLPDKDGLELCAEIRQSPLWADVPVIFVTGRSSESERVEGLRIADDYIAKPFSSLELVARVHAVLRRTKHPHLPSRMVVGALELDPESMEVQVQGREVTVTTLEFRLLAHLASHLGKTFRREQLLDSVWDSRFVTPRTVDVHVRRLREKIEAQPETPQYLQTVRGRGYRLVAPETPVEMIRGQAKRVGSLYPTAVAV
jgi:DNA-binding response OmpR family regulator